MKISILQKEVTAVLDATGLPAVSISTGLNPRDSIK
jgi:hypothetical protein